MLLSNINHGTIAAKEFLMETFQNCLKTCIKMEDTTTFIYFSRPDNFENTGGKSIPVRQKTDLCVCSIFKTVPEANYYVFHWYIHRIVHVSGVHILSRFKN